MEFPTLSSSAASSSGARSSTIRADLSSLSARVEPRVGFSATQRVELASVLRDLDRIENALKASSPGRRAVSAPTEPAAPGTPPEPPPRVRGERVALDPFGAGRAMTVGRAADRLVNGGFEEPPIGEGDYALRSDVPGWVNEAGSIELWRNFRGYTPAAGDQWSELDVGPGASLDHLQQIVETVVGQTYTVSVAYSPRPGTGAASNEFELLFDGQVLETVAADGRGLSDTDWRVLHAEVLATGPLSRVGIRETSSDGSGVLIDAAHLIESVAVAGDKRSADTVLDRGTPVRLPDEAIASGSLGINGTAVAVDVNDDSLRDVVNAINAAEAGVAASLVRTGRSTADGEALFRVELASEGPRMVLEDGGTGLLAALGIEARAYGEVPPASDGGAGDIGPGAGGPDGDASARRRGYRAADALEDLRRSLASVFGESRSAARDALAGALGAIFEELLERHGERRLDGLGLRVADADDGFLSIDRSSRRHFSDAVARQDDALERVLLHGHGGSRTGLIDTLRETVKAQLRESGGSVGSLVDRYA